jgi:hypothetical protein
VSQTQTTITRYLLFRPLVQKSGSDLWLSGSDVWFWFRSLVQTSDSGLDVWFRPLALWPRPLALVQKSGSDLWLNMDTMALEILLVDFLW